MGLFETMEFIGFIGAGDFVVANMCIVEKKYSSMEIKR